MPELHETRMGNKLYESTLPRIANALEDIAKELKRANDKKEEDKKEKVNTDIYVAQPTRSKVESIFKK